MCPAEAPTSHVNDPRVVIGFTSEAGKRQRNEDFVGAVVGGTSPEERRDIALAIADGIGGAKGGRVAAEMAVRGFLDGLWDVPETMEMHRAGARILNSLNRWMHAQGQHDTMLAGMGCTLTALVLRGRIAHALHVGDTRAYRLSGERLTRLTTDHVREGPGHRRALYRALGIEEELRLDYAAQPMAVHDRFLLCSDGVHGVLSDDTIADILRARSAPADASSALVAAALEAGSGDNCTAAVMDVVGLPAAGSAALEEALMRLPIIPAPRSGDRIDGFALQALVSDGPHSRLFAAMDEIEGGDVVLKFPQPHVGEVYDHLAAFVREAWVGTRVNSPFVARVMELPPGRQTCLYTVMPLYQGELLETRLNRAPQVGLQEGRNIAVKLSRAVAALHRAGIIHRDIKPDNVLLESGGSLKLLDLGVVRLPGLEDTAPVAVPGTVAYAAPEMLAGEAGNVVTDIYALGVTMFRVFTGEFPYGNLEATSPARLTRPQDLGALRPDLPAWVGAIIGRAIAIDPAERLQDVADFAQEMEEGPAGAVLVRPRPLTLYERAPVRVWQAISALLALGLLAALFWH